MIDYNKLLSQRALSLKPSGIRRFFDFAAEMEEVISLGVGEPDFKTPWSIRRAGRQRGPGAAAPGDLPLFGAPVPAHL